MKGNDIQVMVKMVHKNKSALCLLYKDARYDQDALDKKYGQMNWQNEYRMVGDILICSISVWDKEKGLWVTKENAGNETQVGEDKGYASDAFKRAATNWGIGRELYRSPDVWINLSDNEIGSYKNKQGKEVLTCKQKFYVQNITFKNGSVNSLVICDSRNTPRFIWGDDNPIVEVPLDENLEEMRAVAVEKVNATTKFDQAWKNKVLKGLPKYNEATVKRLLNETLKGE